MTLMPYPCACIWWLTVYYRLIFCILPARLFVQRHIDFYINEFCIAERLLESCEAEGPFVMTMNAFLGLNAAQLRTVDTT